MKLEGIWYIIIPIIIYPNHIIFPIIIPIIIYLVGGFKHFLFSIIYGIILPIDFHIFQDG